MVRNNKSKGVLLVENEKSTPTCFHNIFSLIEDVHNHATTLSKPGGIFTTHYNTVRFGIKSITAYFVRDWNKLIMECPTYCITDD